MAAAESSAVYARLLPAPDADDLRLLQAAAARWAAEHGGPNDTESEAAAGDDEEEEEEEEEEYWRPPPSSPRLTPLQRDAVSGGEAVASRVPVRRAVVTGREKGTGVEAALALAAAAVAIILTNSVVEVAPAGSAYYNDPPGGTSEATRVAHMRERQRLAEACYQSGGGLCRWSVSLWKL